MRFSPSASAPPPTRSACGSVHATRSGARGASPAAPTHVCVMYAAGLRAAAADQVFRLRGEQCERRPSLRRQPRTCGDADRVTPGGVGVAAVDPAMTHGMLAAGEEDVAGGGGGGDDAHTVGGDAGEAERARRQVTVEVDTVATSDDGKHVKAKVNAGGNDGSADGTSARRSMSRQGAAGICASGRYSYSPECRCFVGGCRRNGGVVLDARRSNARAAMLFDVLVEPHAAHIPLASLLSSAAPSPVAGPAPVVLPAGRSFCKLRCACGLHPHSPAPTACRRNAGAGPASFAAATARSGAVATVAVVRWVAVVALLAADAAAAAAGAPVLRRPTDSWRVAQPRVGCCGHSTPPVGHGRDDPQRRREKRRGCGRPPRPLRRRLWGRRRERGGGRTGTGMGGGASARNIRPWRWWWPARRCCGRQVWRADRAEAPSCRGCPPRWGAAGGGRTTVAAARYAGVASLAVQ